MSVEFSEGSIRLASLALLGVTALLALLVISRFDDGGGLLAPLRERWVYGIPWGTVIVVASVYLLYHVVQGGSSDGGPVVVGFRSWSLWYPQGLFFSSFAHASESHLWSNLLGAIAFAPIVEYVWGHYPTERNRIDGRFTRPRSRIALFVSATVAVGIANSLFIPGAIIGFSTVVFAFAGFALLTRPLLTVVAMLGIQVVRLLRQAVLDPLVLTEAQTRFVSPSWADTALQGHLFGMLLGVLLAVVLLRIRSEQPRMLYVFFAALVFAVTRSMYAIYWYLGADEFVLFQALGAAAVLLLATLGAIVALAPHRARFPQPDVPLRSVAVGLLLVTVLAIAVVGVGYNVVSVSPGDEFNEAIEVEDYHVTYVDGAEDQYIGGLDVPGLDPPSVSVTGVVVASEERNAWHLETSGNALAFHGETRVVVGDATWRDTVLINRTEWAMVDGNETYTVFGQHGTDDRTILHEASPAVSDSRIQYSNVSIRPADGWYALEIERNGSVLGTEPVPSRGESVTIGETTFTREDDDLFATHNGTELRIAEFRLDGQ